MIWGPEHVSGVSSLFEATCLADESLPDEPFSSSVKPEQLGSAHQPHQLGSDSPSKIEVSSSCEVCILYCMHA
jgi:hypothetical protein